MHAIIRFNRSIARVLKYHQQKVNLGSGENIAAENFVLDREKLTLAEAQYQFDLLHSRNDRVARNVLHVFLSFDEHEKIDNGKMAAVAEDYLEGMGFQQQPWLAYRHYDSLIPHAHLVSSTVREDGVKLKIEMRDLYHSRDLTHALEESYGLNKGNRQSLLLDENRHGWDKIEYGEKPLYPSINRVLEEVVPNYAYTSLDELNAVLSLHNLRAGQPVRHADTGGHNGLYYRALTDEGVPLKSKFDASIFPSKPTLANLEDRFAANQLTREPARSHLATAIDWCLTGTPLSVSALKEALAYEGISVVTRQDAAGQWQNCWFVDHNSRTVFESAELGENYSAANLAIRCIPEETYRRQQAGLEQQSHRRSLHL